MSDDVKGGVLMFLTFVLIGVVAMFLVNTCAVSERYRTCVETVKEPLKCMEAASK